MTILASTALSSLALALAVGLLVPGRPGPRRLIGPVSRPWTRIVPRTGSTLTRRERTTHRIAAAAASGGLLLAFGLPWGLLLGAAAYLAVPVGLSRLEPAETRRRTRRIVSDLPLTVDLLAACLRAGRPPDEAVATVGQGVGGPLADLLAEVERRLRLGADPEDAWSCLLAEPACAGIRPGCSTGVAVGRPAGGHAGTPRGRRTAGTPLGSRGTCPRGRDPVSRSAGALLPAGVRPARRRAHHRRIPVRRAHPRRRLSRARVWAQAGGSWRYCSRAGATLLGKNSVTR